MNKSKIFSKNIEKEKEDSKKLNEDYKALSKKYDKSNLMKIINKDGSQVIYPIVCLGTGYVSLKDENKNESVIIKDNKHDFYKLPPIVEQNFLTIFAAHSTSTIYNNLNIRVKDMCLENNQLKLETERTTYYNSLVTNRASDFKLTDGVTVRELFEAGPWITPLKYSKLSNHLGFNGFVESSDGYIVFIKRSNNVSIGKGTYSDSIGASLKVKYAVDKHDNFVYSGLRNAILGEIVDELKI